MADAHTPSLLLAAVRVAAPRLIAALHAGGHTAIRPRHIGIFAHLDPHGTRFMTLAERAGLGTPALGALVDELERLRYLKPRAHAVGRAQLVTPTATALDVMRLITAFNEHYEMELRRTLGGAAYESFRRSLETLANIGGEPLTDRSTRECPPRMPAPITDPRPQ